MNEKSMLAFHNDAQIKEDLLTQLYAHQRADEIIQGVYWEQGKGCAVGCTIHSSDHALYETKLGIPRIIAYLEDRIFEGLPNEAAKQWPIQLIEAIPVGADLSDVWRQFVIWLLVDPQQGAIRLTQPDSDSHRAIAHVAQLYIDRCTDTDTWDKARAAAARAAVTTLDAWSAAMAWEVRAAAEATWAAEAAARAAAAMDAADAAWAAADAARAEEEAEQAACETWVAMEAAMEAADAAVEADKAKLEADAAAAAAWEAWVTMAAARAARVAAARDKAYQSIAHKLIQLLQLAPVP